MPDAASILRDPYTNKPFVMFYVTRRVGGGVLDPNAIKVLKLPAKRAAPVNTRGVVIPIAPTARLR